MGRNVHDFFYPFDNPLINMKNVDVTSYFYSNAILPKKFTICGVELKPFSMGHLMLLEHTGNPIVDLNIQKVSLNDSIYYFFHALLICALDYEDNLKIFDDSSEYDKYAKTFITNLYKNMEVDKHWNVVDKLLLFEKYISYYMDMPLYTEEGTGDTGIPSGSDWKQNLFLIFKKLGYTDKEILNMNFKQLFYIWSSYAESEGAIKVMNKFDIQQLKAFKANNRKK